MYTVDPLKQGITFGGKACQYENNTYRFQYFDDVVEADERYIREQSVAFLGFFMNQVSDIQSAQNSQVEDHVQSVNEISYIAEGSCRMKVNNTEFDCTSGDIVVFKKNDVHAYVSNNDAPVRIINAGYLFFETENDPFSETMRYIEMSSCPILIHGDSTIENLFMLMLNELLNQNDSWQYFVGMIMRQMHIQIYRHVRDQRRNPYSISSMSKNGDSLVYSVVMYINQNLGEVELMKMIPEEFHYSYSYISHLFKEIVGCSLSQYYSKCRFERAGNMLLEGTQSITEIAALTGFQSIHAFSKAFKKYYGITPSLYAVSKEKTSSFVSVQEK